MRFGSDSRGQPGPAPLYRPQRIGDSNALCSGPRAADLRGKSREQVASADSARADSAVAPYAPPNRARAQPKSHVTGPTALCCGSSGTSEAVRRGSGGRGVQAVQDRYLATRGVELFDRGARCVGSDAGGVGTTSRRHAERPGSTPWVWTMRARGGRTSAARRSTSSSGVNGTPAVPSAHRRLKITRISPAEVSSSRLRARAGRAKYRHRRSRSPASRPPTAMPPCSVYPPHVAHGGGSAYVRPRCTWNRRARRPPETADRPSTDAACISSRRGMST